MNKYIYLFVGESGSGKNTIMEQIAAEFNYTILPSYTTRRPRYPNEDGHIFISDALFDRLENICAYTEFANNRYCATSEQVDEYDLYAIDPSGVEFFKANYKGHKTPIVFYIYTTPDERAVRMAIRGDTNEQIKQRLENDRVMFQDVEDVADYVIRNFDLQECVDGIVEIIKSMRCET